MEFSRQDQSVAISFFRDLPNPGMEPGSPALQADSLLSEPPREAPILAQSTLQIGVLITGRIKGLQVAGIRQRLVRGSNIRTLSLFLIRMLLVLASFLRETPHRVQQWLLKAPAFPGPQNRDFSNQRAPLSCIFCRSPGLSLQLCSESGPRQGH